MLIWEKKYLILSIYKPKFLLYSKLSIYRAYNRWALPVCFIMFLYEYFLYQNLELCWKLKLIC